MPGFLDFTSLFRRKPRPGPAPAAESQQRQPKTQDDPEAADRYFATGDWTMLDSSHLHSAMFYSHGHSGTIRMRFKNKKTGAITATVEYYGVDPADWANLLAAGPQGTPNSQGVYFSRHIRLVYPFSYV